MEMVRPGEFLGASSPSPFLPFQAPSAFFAFHYIQVLTPDLPLFSFFYRHDAMVLPLPDPRQRRETRDYPRSDILLFRFGYAVETCD